MESAIVRCRSCGTRNRVPGSVSGSPQCGKCHRPLPWIVNADDATFDEVSTGTHLPVLVDLWAPWCGPCRVVSPVLEQLAGELAGRLKLVKVDVDRAPRVQSRFAVQGVPTLVLLRDGREAGRRVGAAPIGELRSWLEASVDPANASRR